MNLTLSLLDLFTYFIPGSIFLYTIIEFLALFGILDIDYSNLTSSPFIFISIFLSYILGHVLFALNAHIWEPLIENFPWNKNDFAEKSLEDFKTQYSELPIEFEAEDSTLLYSLLRERNSPNFALETIFRQLVYNQLSRNLSFVILVLAFKQFLAFFMRGYSLDFLIIGILLLLTGILLRRWSKTHWYFHHLFIFCASIAYGTSLEAVLYNNEPKWDTTARRNISSPENQPGDQGL